MAVGFLAPGLAGCGDDASADIEEEGSSEPGEPPSEEEAQDEPDVTTTTLPDSAEIVDAYERANEAMIAAYSASDTEHPDLLDSMGGDSLESVQGAIETFEADGYRVEIDWSHEVAIGEIEPHRATVTVCWYMEQQVFDLAVGELLGDLDPSMGHSEEELEWIDGEWILIGSEPLDEACDWDSL